MGCTLIAFLSLTAGLVLEAVAHGRMEIKRLGYLAIPPYDADPAVPGPADVPPSGLAVARFGEPGLLPVRPDTD